MVAASAILLAGMVVGSTVVSGKLAVSEAGFAVATATLPVFTSVVCLFSLVWVQVITVAAVSKEMASGIKLRLGALIFIRATRIFGER
ncbi:hypothetical protein GCM10027299_48000 [Larkinella ripae]